MEIIDKFVESKEDDFVKFVMDHLEENSLQYSEDLLNYALSIKDKSEDNSPEFLDAWSIQISCECHLVKHNVYERIHDITNSKVTARKL